MMTTSFPPATWAQRKDIVYFSIDLNDMQNEVVELSNLGITFTAEGKDSSVRYALDEAFYDDIDAKRSTQTRAGRWLHFVLTKVNPGPFWPRLLANNEKAHWLKFDFHKWVDEDSESEESMPETDTGEGLENLKQMLSSMGDAEGVSADGSDNDMNFGGLVREGAETVSAEHDESSEDEDDHLKNSTEGASAATESAEARVANETAASPPRA